MKLLQALILTVTSPWNLDARCDLIELNHYYDYKGLPIFDQIILWNRDPATGRFNVADWTIADYNKVYSSAPEKTDYGCIVRHFNSTTKKVVNVRAPLFRESWTQADPERENKKRWPEERRVKIFNVVPMVEAQDETK